MKLKHIMAIIRKSLMEIKQSFKNISSSDSERLLQLKNMPDQDIDLSDIPEVNSDWVKNVKAAKKDNKVVKTIRFDKKVMDFVQKKQGRGYQTLINNILTEWAKHHGMKA